MTVRCRPALLMSPSALAALVCAALAMVGAARPAWSQDGVEVPKSIGVPGFWDPRRRPERPDLSRIQSIRFLTETDYPPFNYAGADGNPTGFNVDLARQLCAEIKASCTIQARRFDLLLDALADNRGDAVIASIAATATTRQRADFTDPYYRTPARFVVLVDSPIRDVLPELVEGKKIAVVAGTAHEAFLKEMFTGADIRPYPNADAARAALRNKEVDLLFGDGIGLAFWLNGSDSAGCCAFRGGPFLEARFFGEGVGIAVKRGNDLLRQALNWALFHSRNNALNWALFREWESGSFADLWLRYFPISPF